MESADLSTWTGLFERDEKTRILIRLKERMRVWLREELGPLG